MATKVINYTNIILYIYFLRVFGAENINEADYSQTRIIVLIYTNIIQVYKRNMPQVNYILITLVFVRTYIFVVQSELYA